MRKTSVNSAVSARTPANAILVVSVLAVLLITAGCTTGTPAPLTTPPATIERVPVTTMTVAATPTTESPDLSADRAFALAADACYNQTPVIRNLSTRITFATCMENTPLPLGNCARNYRYYVLRATNEDATSAGFARQSDVNRLAREAYLRGEGYDGVRLEYAPCGNATLIPTSIYR